MALNFYELLIQGEYGWGGQLIPLILIFFLSYALAKKIRDILWIQFPLTVCFALLFPFLSTAVVIFSLALFMMNIVGSKDDVLGEVKAVVKRSKEKAAGTYEAIAKKEAQRIIDRDAIEAYKEKILQRK